MSAAARPKRWGVFRQVKGSKFDPTKFEIFTLLNLTGRTIKGTWGDLGRQKEIRNDIHEWIASDGSELVPTTDGKKRPTCCAQLFRKDTPPPLLWPPPNEVQDLKRDQAVALSIQKGDSPSPQRIRGHMGTSPQ
jgi:hypothetical protein